MKAYVTLAATILLLLFSYSYTGAWHEKEPVTPYGDFCKRCGKYGTCKSKMSPEDAVKAMGDYYGNKGLDVEVVKSGERFMRAKIKDSEGIVDVIIFDRRTGRIRSIY